MPTPLTSQAIQIALTGNWEMAISVNKEILKENPNDLDALNRLAFAYTVRGKIREAKKTYQRVLDIDKLNSLALKNLKKLSELPVSKQTARSVQILSNTFLEESGKTKVLTLINAAPPKAIRTLQVGQAVQLSIKRLKIFVLDDKKQYIGMLPDDIGKRITLFLKGGNMYEACVKSADNHTVSIFIKETKRATKFKNQPSFLLGDKSHLSLQKLPKGKDYFSDSEEEEEGE
ncbi:MAG: tetratricopeptide repeat protein [Candidatus Levyibacteriota bacterium]